VICIIRIPTAFVLNEGEPTSSVNDIRVDFKVAWDRLTDDLQQFEVLEYRSERGDHIWKNSR
jgi:hypothetical protein